MPQEKRSPAASRSRFRPLKSLGRTVALALTSIPTIALGDRSQHEVNFDLILVAIMTNGQLLAGKSGRLGELSVNEALQMRPQFLPVLGHCRRRDPLERRQQTGIQKVQLRRLDEPFQPATMPSEDTSDQEHVFEQGEPAVDRLAVDANSRSEGRQVEQLACGNSRVVDQAAQVAQLDDGGDIGDIAFGERAGISPQPAPPPGRNRTRKSFGKTAGDDSFRQAVGRSRQREVRKICGKGSIQEVPADRYRRSPLAKTVGARSSRRAPRANQARSSPGKGRPSP